jgi:hypothetical protein
MMSRNVSMMLLSVAVFMSLSLTQAFVPMKLALTRPQTSSYGARFGSTSPTARQGMLNPEEGDAPNQITRDNEPEDFFQTNTDKMSDGEKIPVAVIGLLFISAPFVLGLIALYASK